MGVAQRFQSLGISRARCLGAADRLQSKIIEKKLLQLFGRMNIELFSGQHLSALLELLKVLPHLGTERFERRRIEQDAPLLEHSE